MDERDDGLESKEKTTKYPAPFSVRLSTEEREELERLAPDQPWGQYIKDVIFREKRKPRTREAQKIKDHKLLARLLGPLGQSRISQNINQLAKAANSGSLPKGFIDPKQKCPLNYTRSGWQQAARTGRNPKVIKASLQECWAVSDSRKAFETALKERGFELARGDRRGFVAVDVYGEVYSLSRQLGVKAKDLKQRLGDPRKLPSVDETKEKLVSQISALFKGYMAELDAAHEKTLAPLLATKRAMTAAHRKDRAAQKEFQEKRWQREENARAARLRKGLKGVWDKLTGKYWKYRNANEKEAWQAILRDRAERQDLIERHLAQRQSLQKQFDAMREKHEQERQNLMSDLSRMTSLEPDLASPDYPPDTLRGRFRYAAKAPSEERDINPDLFNSGRDAEPDAEPELLAMHFSPKTAHFAPIAANPRPAALSRQAGRWHGPAL